MKKIILLILVLLGLIRYTNAQDSVKVKNRLTQSVYEQYYVLKNNKSIKQGLYQAIYRGRIAIASGLYQNNKKVGMWHFYDTRGRLVENFNYEQHAVLFEEADDSISSMHIKYSFDHKLNPSDRVTKPIKIGGRSYGYLPYLKFFRLPDDFLYGNVEFTAILEVLVSPGGRLADFKIHIKTEDDDQITSFSTDLIDESDKIFVPATINYKPVLSRIFVKCRVTDNGDLDLD